MTGAKVWAGGRAERSAFVATLESTGKAIDDVRCGPSSRVEKARVLLILYMQTGIRLYALDISIVRCN